MEIPQEIQQLSEHLMTCLLLQVAEMERKLKEQCKVDFNVKIYPGQSHGFVHRKRENVSSHDKPYIEEARKDMLMWLNRYL